MKHGCRFQAIDLRWGVSEEANNAVAHQQAEAEVIRSCKELALLKMGSLFGKEPV